MSPIVCWALIAVAAVWMLLHEERSAVKQQWDAERERQSRFLEPLPADMPDECDEEYQTALREVQSISYLLTRIEAGDEDLLQTIADVVELSVYEPGAWEWIA